MHVMLFHALVTGLLEHPNLPWVPNHTSQDLTGENHWQGDAGHPQHPRPARKLIQRRAEQFEVRYFPKTFLQ